MMEPGRKCRLGCYTKFSNDLLNEALTFFDDSNFSVHVALDNEMMYVEWEDSPILDTTLRRRVARALNLYSRNKDHLAFQKRYMIAAPCLRLIVLGRDDEAKAKWPDAYAKLKGKPLNAIQVASIETLLHEADEIDSQEDGIWLMASSKSTMRDEFRYGVSIKELDWKLTGKKMQIFKQMCKIRGW